MKTLDFPSSDGGSYPTPSLQFIELPERGATELIIEHHYLHRRCQITWSWGIKSGSEIVGVLTIGKPATWSAMSSVVGEKYSQQKNASSRAKDVYELNRLWLSDKLPRNTESQFIGWCLRELKKKHKNAILISYAEGKMNHVGYVYQATNWTYLGLSAEFDDITVDGFGDYRSVPEDVRGGVVYECKQHGFFEGPLPRKSKQKSKDLPAVPNFFPCPHCGTDAKKCKARAWAFVREPRGPLVKRDAKLFWNHITLDGRLFQMRLTARSRKHQYIWFVDACDKLLLPKKFWSVDKTGKLVPGFPYPKIKA